MSHRVASVAAADWSSSAHHTIGAATAAVTSAPSGPYNLTRSSISAGATEREEEASDEGAAVSRASNSAATIPHRRRRRRACSSRRPHRRHRRREQPITASATTAAQESQVRAAQSDGQCRGGGRRRRVACAPPEAAAHPASAAPPPRTAGTDATAQRDGLGRSTEKGEAGTTTAVGSRGGRRSTLASSGAEDISLACVCAMGLFFVAREADHPSIDVCRSSFPLAYLLLGPTNKGLPLQRVTATTASPNAATSSAHPQQQQQQAAGFEESKQMATLHSDDPSIAQPDRAWVTDWLESTLDQEPSSRHPPPPPQPPLMTFEEWQRQGMQPQQQPPQQPQPSSVPFQPARPPDWYKPSASAGGALPPKPVFRPDVFATATSLLANAPPIAAPGAAAPAVRRWIPPPRPQQPPPSLLPQPPPTYYPAPQCHHFLQRPYILPNRPVHPPPPSSTAARSAPTVPMLAPSGPDAYGGVVITLEDDSDEEDGDEGGMA